MLHLNTIDDATFQLLKTLCSKDYMANFALAGGTSLALQTGHRKSIDIDMFAYREVNMQETSLFLENEFTDIVIRRTTPVFIFCTINQIKSDFVKHSSHRLIKECFTEQGVRMFSKEDIAAMKLNAVCGRGSKKDFYDIYLLLKTFSLAEILSFYEEKFQSDNSYMALKSLQYFEDADLEITPVLIHAFPPWNEIKKTLVKKVNNFKFK
jgi:predicted nucleotidyltransferase component of viral defense system